MHCPRGVACTTCVSTVALKVPLPPRAPLSRVAFLLQIDLAKKACVCGQEVGEQGCGHIYIYTHTLYMFVQYVVGICVYIYIHIYLCVSFNKRTENAR